MDLEFMILDTFDLLRPKLIKFQSLEESQEVCNAIENRENANKEFNDIIREYHERDLKDDYYDEEYYDYDEEADEGDNDKK